MGRNVKDGVVNDYQLALLSKSIFDIGPRTRFLILMAGVVGIALAFMASLDSHKQVPLDKIIHFSGYFTLSATFVLALRPILFIPGLLGLVTMGVVIEFLQRHTGRQFDPTDMIANTLGVVSGGTVYRMNLRELMESAGGSELPVSLVLGGLCGKLRVLADQLAKSGRGISVDSTMA